MVNKWIGVAIHFKNCAFLFFCQYFIMIIKHLKIKVYLCFTLVFIWIISSSYLAYLLLSFKSFQSVWWMKKSFFVFHLQGMDIIENLNPTEFTNYLKKYGNTICGRHPIGVLLQAVQEILRNDPSQNASFKFLKYAQSSQCRNMNDSSVSYASGALLFE